MIDVAFCDPPYPLLGPRASRAAVLEAVHAVVRTMLAPEGVLVLHTPLRAVRAAELAADLDASERDYGSNALWYLQAATGPADGEGADSTGSDRESTRRGT